MNELIIQPEPGTTYFCMFDIIVVYIDLNTSLMSLSLIIFFAIEFK